MNVDYRPVPNEAQVGLIRDRIWNAHNGVVVGDIGRGREGSGPSALGACIFGGGFSFGVEEAGFNVAGHLELPDLALGVTPSRQRWPVVVAPFEASAGEMSWRSIAQDLKDKGAVPDFVYANPPCVAYAGTGKHDGAGDARMCYLRYCSYGLAMDLEPTVWAWELVPGVYGKEPGLAEAMAYRAKKSGYRCYVFLTSSAIHGGYQDRRRFHFIASKVELDFAGVYEREPSERKTVYDLRYALEKVCQGRIDLFNEKMSRGEGDYADGSELGVLPNDSNLYTGAFRAILPYCPPGAHLRDVPPSIMRTHYRPRGTEWSGTGVPGFAHTRGRMDRPSPNVLGGHTIFHPEEDRYLTPRENATIMGFPLDYEFSSGTKAYAEIGKGLCTHNAAFLARVVHDGLMRDKGATPTANGGWSNLTVIDWRNNGPKLNLKMSLADTRQWYMEHGGQIPPELLGKSAAAPALVEPEELVE